MMGADYIRRADAVKIADKYGLTNGSVLGRHTGLADCIASEIAALPSIDAEFVYLQAFAKTGDFDYQLARDQLRALWTAYCFHEGLDVDTARYDRYLRDLWDAIPAGSDLRDIDWHDFEAFDNFMCAYLV